MARRSILQRARRAIARVIAPDSARSYDAARWRQVSGTPSHGPINAETLAAAPAIRSRARYFVSNNPHASAGVNALVVALYGPGITPASTHADADTRADLAAAFNAWAQVADADGRTDLHGLIALAVRMMIQDGESFLQLIETRRGLRVRLIPAEQIDESKTVDLSGDAYVVAGIEFNAAGERVAYWVFPTKPNDVHTYAPSVRIAAADMLHLMAPVGAGQVRGVSWLAPVLLRLADTDQLEDALLVGFKVAALHSGFLTDMNGAAGDLPYEGDQSGSLLTSGLEPGTLKRLPAGMDVKFNSPQQAQQSVEFLQSQLRAISAGLGVPEFLLTNDVSRANYSSLRAALIAFKTRIEQVQFATIIPQVMRPLWERFVMSSILAGRVQAADFEADPEGWLGAEFYPPAMPWADPLKDIQATREAIQAGLMSRRQAVAAQGYAIEDLDAEIAADREREESLGLTFAAPSPQPQQSEAPNADA